MASRDFSTALSWAKEGHIVRRREWDTPWRVKMQFGGQNGRYLVMSDGHDSDVWTPTTADLFAGDWDIIDQNAREA